jgi:hypothetical protein
MKDTGNIIVLQKRIALERLTWVSLGQLMVKCKEEGELIGQKVTNTDFGKFPKLDL